MFPVAVLLLLAAGSYVKCERLTQPASVTVQPGQPLTISCQVSYALSSYYTAWIRQPAGKGLEWIGMRHTGASYYKDSLKTKFSIELDTSSKTVTLKGQNMQPGDTAVYYCARERGNYAFDYWGQGTMVTVTSATASKPTVFPLMPCGPGIGTTTVTLGCLATGYTPSPLTFTWSRDGAALTDFIQYPSVLKGDLYTGVSQIEVPRQAWDASAPFQCNVTHVAGNAGTFFKKPKVLYQSPDMKVSATSGEHNEVSFNCFAKKFSPKDHQIKWLKDGVAITDKISEYETSPVEEKGVNGTLYSVASILTVHSSDVSATSKITCDFEGKNGKANNNFTLDYNPGGGGSVEPCATAAVDVHVEDPSVAELFEQKTGTIKCHVKMNKPTVEKIFWEDKNGEPIVGASMIPNPRDTTYTLPLDITYDEWSKGIKVNCVVEHSDLFDPIRTLYERKSGEPTQRPSVFMMLPVEHIKKQMVTLTCYVKDFYPEEVYVSWLVDDEVTKDTFNTTSPIEKQGAYSAYGQLTLGLDQWKEEGSVYSCVVYHQSLVSNTKAIVRSIAYKEFEKLNLVNLSLNIPDTCKTK